MEASELPIGIFDSGVGGLSVLRAVAEVLPGEDLIYLGDTARVPYGGKSASTIRRYARENALFLSQFSIKLLIVACNTATAFALEDLNTFCPFPVLGVILPGAEEAVRRTRHDRIGVLGTRGTVSSGAYERAISFLDPGIEVTSQVAPLLVPLVEENLLNHPATSLLLTEYLDPLMRAGVDTLLLGCTHFPLLQPAIQRLVGNSIQVVDSASCCAAKVQDVLQKLRLARKTPSSNPPRFFVTDDSPDLFKTVGQGFLGFEIAEVTVLDGETYGEGAEPIRQTRRKPQSIKRTPAAAPRIQGQGAKGSTSKKASANSHRSS